MAADTTISYTLPTHNEDGTALTDLKHVEIYSGCERSGVYPDTAVNPATSTTIVITGMPDWGTCYFVAVAVNSQDIRSRHSDELAEYMGDLPLPNAVEALQVTVDASTGAALLLDIRATIRITDISERNPIQAKQTFPERGYVFEVVSGTTAQPLRLESWPAGASQPIIFEGQTPILEGESYDVRLTHDGTQARLYVDGRLDGERLVPPPLENTQPVETCRYVWTQEYTRVFNGSCVVQ